MRSVNSNARWGWLLVGLGLLTLLGNFNLLSGLTGVVWAALFALPGAVFLGWALRQPQHWWAFLPSGGLFGLALAAASDGAAWGGPAFLAAIGAGFLTAAARRPEQWWALIPGGLMLSLALAATFPGQTGGAFLFLGLAVTFATLALLPAAQTHAGAHRWAWYPAAGALLLAALSGGWLSGAWGTLWPLALIVLGAGLLIAPRRGRH